MRRKPKKKRLFSRTRFLRALILGALLIPINLSWLMKAETLYNPVYSTLFTLFWNATLTLFVLVILNALLKKLMPSLAFSQEELLIVYVMLCIATGIFGHDLMVVLIRVIAAPFWYATPENEWKELFFRHIPRWLTVHDNNALSGYFTGDSTLYTAKHIKAWLTPALLWSSFLIVLLFVLVCINIIFRKQWTEKEKLSFPIIQLPLEMTREETGLLRNKLFLIGFSIAGGMQIINGIHAYFPSVPGFRIAVDIGVLFSEKPFSAIGFTPVVFSPFVVGLAYLMPLDLAFSMWFFHLVWKAQEVFRSAMSLKVRSGPYRSYQTAGALIALAFILLWTNRRYLKEVVVQLFRRKLERDDSNEPMTYRTAVVGIVLGTTFLVLFLYRGGMSIYIIIAFLSIYFLYMFSITRIRAKLGPPAHDFEMVGPEQWLLNTVGARNIGPRNLTMFGLLYWMCRAYRSHPVGHQLEGFKIAERIDASGRRFLLAIIIAIILGTLTGFWVFLHYSYSHGTVNSYHAFGGEPFRRLEKYLQYPGSRDYSMIKLVGVGAVVTTFLMAIRRRFLGFPFHPVGYAMAGGWLISCIWFSIFLSWLVKWVLLKYGGLRTYRRAVPFFLGLILGQHVVGGLWTILEGEILGKHVYEFFLSWQGKF